MEHQDIWDDNMGVKDVMTIERMVRQAYEKGRKSNCSFCNPELICKKHQVEQAKNIAEISESLDLEHDTSQGVSE